MRHSKEQILKFLKQLENKKAEEFESETLDFKEWISDRKKLYKKLIEYAVCFANQKGGTLVLGVRDRARGREKAITGCTGYNIDEIKTNIYEATDPKILVDIEEVFIDGIGVTILLIHIPQGIGIHTTTGGTSKIRIGKDCKPLTGSMRQKRLVELGFMDLTAEIIEGLSYDDLDKVEIQRLKNILRARKPESSLLKLSDRDLLKQIGIIKNGYPTIAGLLLVGKEEDIEKYVHFHEVTYLHMANDINYDKRIDGKNGILCLLEDIYRNIEHYNKITTVKIGLFHFEIKDFPEDTYREAILNAILHRDYTSLGSVFIKHYDDRIEISNPGGFIGGITPENILRQDSKPRNRYLAEVLRKIGLVEKAGMGVKRMFYTQLASGKELPSYFSAEHFVKVIIKDGTIDEPFVKFVKESEKQGKWVRFDELLILSVLRRQRELSLKEAASILQLDVSRTREILMKMIKRGFLEKSGVKKGLIYRLSSNIYKQLGESVSYIREKGIDEVRYPELILEYVKNYGSITNRQVRELLGVDKYKASRVLKKLIHSGKLKRIGRGKKDARYILG
ncbi:MAG TPA: hypothetical protein ENI51_09280 [Candidatus Atribacteria bacterium]|nr:hypothetical protein [Candidatus Atribacteria bacterium]